MLKEEKLKQLKGETQKLKRLLVAGEAPDATALQEFCHLVESVTLEVALLGEEYGGYKASHERLASGLEALSALGSFRAQETVPEQWAIEHKGVVVASGSSLIEAAHGLNKRWLKSCDLASVTSDQL